MYKIIDKINGEIVETKTNGLIKKVSKELIKSFEALDIKYKINVIDDKTIEIVRG